MDADEVVVAAAGEQVALGAQHRVHLPLVEQVDPHASRLEEDRLCGQLIGADALGSALGGHLEQARHLAATARDPADLERDLSAGLLVLREEHGGEAPATQEPRDTVALYDLTYGKLHHPLYVPVASAQGAPPPTTQSSVSPFSLLS